MSALFDKLVRGEVLTQEEKSKLTPEELTEANKKLLESIDGRREELRRLEDKKNQHEQQTVSDFSKKFLEEQTSKAEGTVFFKLQSQGVELTEEKKQAIRDMRKKIDNGSVTYDSIVDDFLAAAAAVNRGPLFDAFGENVELKKNAAQFVSQGAGANGSGGPGSEDGKKFSQQVWDWVEESRKQGIIITPEQAQKFLTEGQKRVY